MFFFLTHTALLLSGIYECYRLFDIIGSYGDISESLSEISSDSAAYEQLLGVQNGMITEAVICGVLLLLTVICLILYIKNILLRSLFAVFNSSAGDFIRTTNRSGNNSSRNIGKRNADGSFIKTTNNGKFDKTQNDKEGSD